MIENKMPSENFKALYKWMKTHQDLFPGGILKSFKVPTRSPFCILEIPRNGRTVEQNLSSFWQVQKYDCGLQIGIESRDLWDAMLLSLDLMAVLNERMTMCTLQDVGEFSIQETEYFVYEKETKNKALLFGSRMKFTLTTELSIANPESAYENIQMRIMEFNKASVLSSETFPIAKENDDEQTEE